MQTDHLREGHRVALLRRRNATASRHTHTDPENRQADITAAVALARRQGATLFEMRAALDLFKLRGEAARCVG
jgi:hypothetical protein